MAQFDFWVKWASRLSDKEFARAWMALGAVAASDARRATLEQNLFTVRDSPDLAPQVIGGALVDIVVASVQAAPGDAGPSIDWRFPDPNDFGDALEHLPPAAWSAAWTALTARSHRPAGGVRVSSWPADEPVAPWYSPLTEVDPAPGAVSMRVVPPNQQFFFDWPLRFGTFASNAAARILSDVATSWPSRRLARVLELGRDVSNSDILVHVGTAGGLLTTLGAVPGAVKTNLVILLGAGAEAVDSDVLCADVMRATRASGVVVLVDVGDDESRAKALNRVVEELSHDAPMDRALFAGFMESPDGVPFLRLSDELAGVRLRKVGEQLKRRLGRLPAHATVNLSQLRHRQMWRVRHGTRTVTLEDPGVDVTHVRADRVDVEIAHLPFDHESDGGSDLAVLAEAVEAAEEPQEAEDTRAARFLQEQSFVKRGEQLHHADGGFLLGHGAVVLVRIGRPDATWESAAAAFPVARLPAEYHEWRLTVWLTEPRQLDGPMRGEITLPRDGDSSEATFEFMPKVAGDFEGRLTVMHRGRVLQTAVLVAKVRHADDTPEQDGTPRLTLPVAVRQHIGDLDGRREFDLAFVLNHTEAHEPRAVALSRGAAGVLDLAPSLRIAANISTEMGAVAASEEDFKDGLTGENGRALLVTLAQHGGRLRISLVANLANGTEPNAVDAEYIQIITTKSDTVVPFEFIYDYEVPDDDAQVCPRWRESLETGRCGADCDTTSGRFVCPSGFWGLRKVIERHAAVPAGLTAPQEAFLQSEPGRATTELRLGKVALVAGSSRVTPPMLKKLLDAVQTCLGAPPLAAASWTEWVEQIKSKPGLILALTHTDGTANETTLEIGGDTLKTILVRRRHVALDTDGRPIVALLGCDTAGTADAYGEPIAVFRDRGAAIVVGTIATVLGAHAAGVAELLTKALLPGEGAPPERLGEAMRTVRRRGLLDNQVIALCIVAYGDADWRLTR